MIDPGLAPHRRVHLREQGGRELHAADAALVARRGKTRDIADHAPAQRQHDGVPIELFADQLVEYPAGGLQRLVLLPVRQNAFGEVSFAQGRAQLFQVQRPHGRVGDDHEIAGGDFSAKERAIGQQSRTDRDAIPRVP